MYCNVNECDDTLTSRCILDVVFFAILLAVNVYQLEHPASFISHSKSIYTKRNETDFNVNKCAKIKRTTTNDNTNANMYE